MPFICLSLGAFVCLDQFLLLFLVLLFELFCDDAPQLTLAQTGGLFKLRFLLLNEAGFLSTGLLLLLSLLKLLTHIGYILLYSGELSPAGFRMTLLNLGSLLAELLGLSLGGLAPSSQLFNLPSLLLEFFLEHLTNAVLKAYYKLGAPRIFGGLRL